MAKEEREAYAALLTSVIVGLLFYSRIGAGMASGRFVGADGLMQWARQVLWLMLSGVGIAIAATILLAIANGILTGDAGANDLVDERDRQIKLRAYQVTMIVMSVGFIGMIAALALGQTVLTALNLMLVLCLVSSVSGEVTRLWLYRRGG